ncbi:MAG TPA: UDP-N-acetylmuramate dehydrogenase [Actinobacteria bacterium]|nr:UDP-N-acetylmuramate dehydrogenase [Actinomycetota bacterium]
MNDARALEKVFLKLERDMPGKVFQNVPLAKKVTFRVGGNVAIFAVADTISDLRLLMKTIDRYGALYFVLGKGSNLLISDDGFRGVAIELGSGFKKISLDGHYLQAGAATPLSTLTQVAWKNGLKGFAFAVGIPGSLGGALVMNAGAHDGCMANITSTVTVYTSNCELQVLNKPEVGFGYRTSALSSYGIIVEAMLRLESGDSDRIRYLMERHFRKRKETQPFDYPSAGSVFKNVSGISAGKIIDEAGCKGLCVGDAQISTKHANFIVNLGKATAQDIYTLIKRVQERVYREKGFLLDSEIVMLGDFRDE